MYAEEEDSIAQINRLMHSYTLKVITSTQGGVSRLDECTVLLMRGCHQIRVLAQRIDRGRLNTWLEGLLSGLHLQRNLEHYQVE